ncbi:hypothetical protein Acor_81580 [Acrocarpospora corrugata]|uniref:Uncharacterized protein n=1 Tax=Acrocarpospora corrugata TaxID=35763 RepID=A0A5M3WCL4_9ACTN|nr:hypothetical protein [Acrocarpospora corrugata]GES06089.1 hypothetical protein Acor_81580 [Acrocarpospora corrugata]
MYGGCTQLREFLQDNGQAYMLRVASSFTLTPAAGTKLTCAQAAKQLAKGRNLTQKAERLALSTLW